MDPVSIIGILTASATLIKICGKTGGKLRDVMLRYQDVPNTLESLSRECAALQASIHRVQSWIEAQPERSINDATFTSAVSSALDCCYLPLQVLEAATERILGNNGNGGRWKKLKFVLNDRDLTQCLEELRWGSHTVSLALSTFPLSTLERTKSLRAIRSDCAVRTSKSSFIGSRPASIFSLSGSDPIPPRLSSTLTSTPPPPRSSITRYIYQNSEKFWGFGYPKFQKVWVRCVLVTVTIAFALRLTVTESPSESLEPVDDLTSCHLCLPALRCDGLEVEKLLKRGARASAVDDQLRTPLHLAAQNGCVDTIALLLKEKGTGWFADDGITPMHLAAANGKTAAVKLLGGLSGHKWERERAFELNATQRLRKATGGLLDARLSGFLNRKTFSARELAAIFDHEDAAVALPDQRKDDLPHALSLACMMGNVRMVETLWLNNGNRWFNSRHSTSRLVEQRRWFPAPALHLAVIANSRPTVAFLLEKGADVRDQSSHAIAGIFTNGLLPYSTPAHYAAAMGSILMFRLLQRKGADVQVVDHTGRTPLSFAVQYGQEDMVDYLLEMLSSKRTSSFSSPERASNWYLGTGHPLSDNLDTHEKVVHCTQRIKTALESLGVTFWPFEVVEKETKQV